MLSSDRIIFLAIRQGKKSAYAIKGALNAFTLSGSEPIKF